MSASEFVQSRVLLTGALIPAAFILAQIGAYPNIAAVVSSNVTNVERVIATAEPIPEPITSMPAPAKKQTALSCLARNIYFEAGVESTKGKYAVAQVTMNRVASGKWGNDVCSVVYAPGQFSWTKILSEEEQNRVYTDANWQESVRVAKDVLSNGTRLPALEKATHYHSTAVRPYWREPKARIGQIGAHIFYSAAKVKPPVDF